MKLVVSEANLDDVLPNPDTLEEYVLSKREGFLEVIIFHDRISIYLRRGEDIIESFIQELGSLGLATQVEFKSPCG